MASPSMVDVINMFNAPSKLAGQTLEEAQKALVDEIAAYASLAQNATTQADSAQQAYDTALAEPEPGLPVSSIGQSLLGNIASAVSGDPRFGQNVQARQAQELSQIQRTRMERLTALRDRYTRLADIAERMKNQDFMLKYNQKEMQVQKLIDAEQKRLDSQRTLAAEGAMEDTRQQGRREITQMEQSGANYRAGLGIVDALVRSGKFLWDPETQSLSKNDEDTALPIKEYETRMKDYRVQARMSKDNKDRLTILQNIRSLAAGSVSTDKTPDLLYARLRRVLNPYKDQRLGTGPLGMFASPQSDRLLTVPEMSDVIQATFDLTDEQMFEFVKKRFTKEEYAEYVEYAKQNAQPGTTAPPVPRN